MDEAKADMNCIDVIEALAAATITETESATSVDRMKKNRTLQPSFSSSSSMSSLTSSVAAAAAAAAAVDPDAENHIKKSRLLKRVQLPIKRIVSMHHLKEHYPETSKVPNDISKLVNSPNSKKPSKKIKHDLKEFYTFCTCSPCLNYREVILLLVDDQVKTRSAWKILEATVKKAYQPMLKNATAKAKYESLLETEVASWLTTGDMNHSKVQHLDFICDLSLTENMVTVLLTAILLVDDPQQFFELMSFQLECVVKAYWEGFSEIPNIKEKRLPAEAMMNYIINGYTEICSISENLSRFLFAFDNNHLKKFSLTWTLLTKRMYQQHVYLNVTDIMLACILSFKEAAYILSGEPSNHTPLIKDYIHFDDEMIQIDRNWKDTWMALNQFNLSEEQQNRRKRMVAVCKMFDVLRDEVTDTGSTNNIDISEWITHENRQLVWQSILSHITAMGSDSASIHLNTELRDDKCKKCNEMLEYHEGSCKCVTCSIAGGPLPPKKSPSSTCAKCLTLSRAEKDGALYESKILNVCASDDLFAFKSKEKKRTNSTEDISETSSVSLRDDVFNEPEELHEYHLSWAVFKHLRDRKPYHYPKIDEKYFCENCMQPPCMLARKILNNEITLSLSWHLIQHYQPLVMSRDDLTVISKNIMQYNLKVVSLKIRLDSQLSDEVFKIYWSFAMSVIACYFVEFGEDTALSLEYFELANNDIQLISSRIKGAEKDGKFFRFLDKICGLPFSDKDTRDSQENYNSSSNGSSSTTSPERFVRTPESEPPEPVTPTESCPRKKAIRERAKKCCFDHSDMTDHCKENHSNKKRIKKECNHARMNETRDRLRKKLSLKAPILQPPLQQPHCSKALSPSESDVPTSSERNKEEDDDSLECLNTLCKRITPQASKSSPTPSLNQLKKPTPSSTQPVGPQSQSVKVQLPNQTQTEPTPLVQQSVESTKKRSNSNHTLSPASGRQRANEFFALLENLPAVSVKKWVNETLSFIEGSNETKGPVNEKKAAKKAKQKQRKEEMKRVLELQDLRSQFHDIYFKEFVAKNELKNLKASKKKDKKKIADYEANIKKLNRAKAKVETSILELIATVKQTNADFKFPYLPTKEQQLEKLQQLGAKHNNHDNESHQKSHLQSPSTTPLPAATILPTATVLPVHENNLNGGSYYSIPYANANDFPQFVMPNLVSTPNIQMCYAPNQPPDVTDPSKRIVTIRRVNLPNVPEPQVTVTAKGSSPDKDKLLYTFVNGQIVQTASPPVPPRVLEQSVPHQAEKVEKTKTQLKKERKRAKKQAEAEKERSRIVHEEQLKQEEELKQQEELKRKVELKRKDELKRQEELKIQEQVEASKNSKKTKKKPQSAPRPSSTNKVENKADSTKSETKKGKKPVLTPFIETTDSQQSTRENSVSSQKVKPKANTKTREKPPEVVVEDESKASKAIKTKEKRQKFIDNGQFDNNQFKMLHLDDFVTTESSDAETEPDVETIVEVEKKIVAPPKRRPAEKTSITINIPTKSTEDTTKTNIPQNTINDGKSKNRSPKPQNKVQRSEPVQKVAKDRQASPKIDNKERMNRNKSTVTPAAPGQERTNMKARNRVSMASSNRNRQLQQASAPPPPLPSIRQQSTLSHDAPNEKPKRTRKTKNKSQISSYQQGTTPNTINTGSKSRRKHSNGSTKSDPNHLLQQSLQNLRLTSNNYPQLPGQQQQDRSERFYSQQHSSNVSIMDQLNRGVQVENLSLPPGITLTKVDPSKSEQLRAKSESIKKLSKPLTHTAPAPNPNLSMPTVITSGFYPHLSAFGASEQTGVIMVEAMGGTSNKAKQSNPQAAAPDVKVSKNRKRRNKKRSADTVKASIAAQANKNTSVESSAQPKMVTLRNPMFGNMIPPSGPSVMPLPSRLPIAPLPMDQPASIIKNENGMFTIRNPALQAAVAKGLPVPSYRQFTGNYYTPPQENSNGNSNNATLGSPFSYFSNAANSGNVGNSPPIPVDLFNSNNGYTCDLVDGSSTQPNPSGKCISAIGSEVKTAQQLKQRSKESQWQGFSAQNSASTQDTAGCTYLGSSLQSNYYNGYDVFSSGSGTSQQLSSGSSLFDNTECPLHHNCDDSPPPTITGFNHYLDGIPNTGIIRYDDASFLKTLMPGQNLNNEVSIHTVNDSNFARNTTSPVAHRVEITPVYGSRQSGANLFGNCTNSTQYSPAKGFQQPSHLGATDFPENIFIANNLLNLNDLDLGGDHDADAFKRFNYDFESSKEKPNTNLNMKDLFLNSDPSGNSSRSSPYVDEASLDLDGFVQNLSTLKISDEQSVNGNLNPGTSPNGWW